MNFAPSSTRTERLDQSLAVRSRHVGAALLWLMLCCAHPAVAQLDGRAQVSEAPGVSARFADPDVRYETPAFQAGRSTLTSHAEALAFVDALAATSPHVRVQRIGRSQQGRAIALAVLAGQGHVDQRKPTVLVLAQQHGNEPAGGEAALAIAAELAGPRAALLERVNVLVMPRTNPDGGDRFIRTTASGVDVNRDHLLLRTPEAQAIAQVLRERQPQVVLDLHEFTVAGRWVDKFGVVQKYDALLQAASVGNLEPRTAAVAARFESRVRMRLQEAGLATFDYHTTSPSLADRVVSMGGVQPDTGRNTAGLRGAVSLLIETRGVGLRRAHLLRRVHTHVLAAMSVIESAASLGAALVDEVHRAQRETAARACRGSLVIAAAHHPTRRAMEFLDAATGEDRRVDVDWRAAEPLDLVRQRPRPCGYLVAEDQAAAVATLRALGVQLQRVSAAARWDVERYEVAQETSGQRQDARGAIDDGGDAGIRALDVRTASIRDAGSVVAPGTWWVSLAQPLGALIAAALEPDSQNSFAANRLLEIERDGLRRVMSMPAVAWLETQAAR